MDESELAGQQKKGLQNPGQRKDNKQRPQELNTSKWASIDGWRNNQDRRGWSQVSECLLSVLRSTGIFGREMA